MHGPAGYCKVTYEVLQSASMSCKALQCTAVHCNILQGTACVLQSTVQAYRVLQGHSKVPEVCF